MSGMNAHFYGAPTFGPGAVANTSEIYAGHQVIVPAYVKNHDLTQGSVIFYDDARKGKVAIQADHYNSNEAGIKTRGINAPLPAILGIARADTGLQSASGTVTTNLTVGVRGLQTVHNYWRGLKMKIGTHVGFVHMYHPQVEAGVYRKPGRNQAHFGVNVGVGGAAAEPLPAEHRLYAWAIHPSYDVQPGMISDLDPLSCAKVCRLLYDSRKVERVADFMYVTRLGTVTRIPSRSGRPAAADDCVSPVTDKPGADIEILMHMLTSSWIPFPRVAVGAGPGVQYGRPAFLEPGNQYEGVNDIFEEEVIA
jgi:hypothetical protein